MTNPASKPIGPGYSSLSAPDDPIAGTRETPFDVDVLRLQQLKDALFAAWEQAPENGIPTALVDLAATYANMLRLQQSLKSQAAIPLGKSRAPQTGYKIR
jgi:hypothetical protein